MFHLGGIHIVCFLFKPSPQPYCLLALYLPSLCAFAHTCLFCFSSYCTSLGCFSGVDFDWARTGMAHHCTPHLLSISSSIMLLLLCLCSFACRLTSSLSSLKHGSVATDGGAGRGVAFAFSTPASLPLSLLSLLCYSPLNFFWEGLVRFGRRWRMVMTVIGWGGT